MTTFAVRRAGTGEGPVLAHLNSAVQQLHHEAQPERYKPVLPHDPALITWFEQQLERPDCMALVAEEAGTAAGYALCFLQYREDTPFTYATSRLLIDQLSVMPHYQRRGVGRLVMETALALARTHQVAWVTLSVIAFNTAALEFYQGQGFTTNSLGMELVVE